MSSFWNNRISISIFGEAQGSAIGVTIDNLPAGEYINADELAAFMARRIPKNIGSRRKYENTVPHIMSGIQNDRTTGSPLCAFLQNNERIAPQHSECDRVSRIGNADYTGAVRYRGFDDVREKCNFSERLTVPLCFAGAICGQILERRGIYTGAHIYRIHNIKDNPFDPVKVSRDAIISIRRKNFPVINDRKGWLMIDDIKRAEASGESLGGVIECAAVNVPAGIGAPIFDGLENNIAQIIFGIPGVSGLEFGAGFNASRMIGSQNNDEFYVDDRGYTVTKTNNHGGILGGISSGMPIKLNVAIKPAFTSKSKNAESKIDIDPCLVPKAVPCIEAAVNIALLSHMIDYPNFC
ncbi:MAG: chorismate synthase [Ruminococcus flavefaciens]|nr:chorismate synthase [Ruminococcus flavefaciens]MCM1361427.1 chorismate synthase [Clostridiales bacterium]MCM1434836.1 chorismate synthase [Ruminococcus flavefaciens]